MIDYRVLTSAVVALQADGENGGTCGAYYVSLVLCG